MKAAHAIWNLDLPANATGRIVCADCGVKFKAKFATKNSKGESVCPGCKKSVTKSKTKTEE